jgi:hypothetical protein
MKSRSMPEPNHSTPSAAAKHAGAHDASALDDAEPEHETDAPGAVSARLAQSPRLSRQRQLIAATFGPAAQRHAAGARPAPGAPVQRLRIALLNLDTKTAAAQQIVNALGAINEPLTDCLGDFEARAILNRLNELEFNIPLELQAQLAEVVDYWDHDEPDTTDKGKVDLAATVVGLLQGVLPLALSGGGAVTLRGGRRAIKDLDFRTVLDPQVTFRTDNAAGTALIETINARLAQGHKVDPLEVSDEPTGYTIKGEVDGVEVSITRTPLVEYGAFEDVGGVPILSKLDLLWDKAYSFIFRREFEKQITDLYDLAHILSLDGREGRMYAQTIKYGGLDKARGPAYTNQAAKVGARGKELEVRPVKELVLQLAEIFESKQKLGKVEQRFLELESAALLKPLHNLWSMLK